VDQILQLQIHPQISLSGIHDIVTWLPALTGLGAMMFFLNSEGIAALYLLVLRPGSSSHLSFELGGFGSIEFDYFLQSLLV